MGISTLITLATIALTTVFGFGIQSATISRLHKDMNGISRKYDDGLIPMVSEMRDRLVKIETLLAIEIQKRS